MSNEVKNSVDNSELIEYLKIRKDAQTEIEIKNIMSKIYKSISTNSKLFYAFSSSIPPQVSENGIEEFESNSLIKPALIYSEKAEPYLPVYTTLEESKNRGTIAQYPYVKALDFIEFSEMVLDESKKIEGLVINPFSDNLVLNKAKIQHLLKIRNENESKVEVTASNTVEELKIIPNKIEEKNQQTSKIVGKASISATSGTYTKNTSQKKKGILVNEYDLRILEYNVLPSRVIKVAINFAKENPSIMALWVFDKRYYLPNDNTQYLGQLIVVEDTLENEAEKEKLYTSLKDIILPQSNANEVFVESIDKQKKDFVRKNVIIPFYQKANVFGEYKKIQSKVVDIKGSVNLVNEIPQNTTHKEDEPQDMIGWESIEAEFFRLYPTQMNPKHYGVLIKRKFGGPDPLDGISVYDAGGYWHFVTFGLSELYEKTSGNKEISGHGLEFTFKLKKGCYEEEEKEIKTICGILQDIAKMIVDAGEVFKANEYIYTGQTTGIDSKGQSKITGFITVLDESTNVLFTPNGRVEFLELVGATDNELKAIIDKKINVRELYQEMGSDITDYNREEIKI